MPQHIAGTLLIEVCLISTDGVKRHIKSSVWEPMLPDAAKYQNLAAVCQLDDKYKFGTFKPIIALVNVQCPGEPHASKPSDDSSDQGSVGEGD